MSTRLRLIKTLSWRVSASTITFLMVFLWYGEWKVATGFGLVDLFIKFILYYYHDLFWEKWMPK